MSSASRTTRRAFAAGVAVVALAAPPALAQQDLRSADAIAASQPAPRTQDLRMPDRRVAPVSAAPKPAFQDLRSADARDDRRAVVVPAPSVPVAEPGFDWGDAAIGGGVLAVLMGLSGTAALAVRRRHSLQVH
jgi:hypothetical protein